MRSRSWFMIGSLLAAWPACGGAGTRGTTPDGGSTVAFSTAGVECSYSHNAYNSSPSVMQNSTVAWSCSATERTVVGNGIPDHATGTFPNPNCPNTISAQNVNVSMPIAPALTGQSAKTQPTGYCLNGVKFDPGTAGTCGVTNGVTTCTLLGNDGAWNIEALGQTSFNFGVDQNNAHVQPNGPYHYHGMPTGFISELNKGQAMTLVGFALDGFPVYARYGYNDANNASSGIKVIKGSYQLKSTPDAGRPPVATYPMGAFSEDYEYQAGSGDLDDCNGRTGVTPEFPSGIYHYYITDTYPFIGRCLKGTALAGSSGPPPDGGASGGADGAMGPKSCTMASDCTGACPATAKGCACGTTPMGMQCVPTCSVSADCPPPPMGGTLTCQNGLCLPS